MPLTAPIDDLIARVQSYDPTVEAKWLHAVYEVAEGAHDGQHRASGESYIEHPLAVAAILAELEMDRETIAAAILHDVVEDTSVTSEGFLRCMSHQAPMSQARHPPAAAFCVRVIDKTRS